MAEFECYRHKRVLVTGNTGFKGAWLTLWLLKLGAKVAGFSIDIPTQPSLFEELNLENDITQYWGDIRDAKQITAACESFRPEMVFHLAAQPIVKQAYQDPHYTFETNVMGMVNILEAIRKINTVKCAVLITSDKCYENLEWPYGYREIDRLGGKDPYSASKGCAELVAHAYWHSFFANNSEVKFATTRAGNVIGGGDWAIARLVPDMMRAWTSKNKLSIRAPQATRPWQHVLEPLSGYLCLGEQLYTLQQQSSSLAYNFGPREDTVRSVAQVIEGFTKFWPAAQWEVMADVEIKEASLLKLDCSKALHDFSWQAVLDFTQTIDFTATWYQAYYQGKADLKQYSIAQIDKHIELAQQRGQRWAVKSSA